MTIASTLYKVAPESRMGFVRRIWKTVSLFWILTIFLAGWITIVYFQLSGRYVCTTVMVQMGDDFVAALGTFNGLYDLESAGKYVPFKERRVQYIERRSQEIVSSGRGMFGYCGDIKAWTFRLEATDSSDDSDPCNWVARSSETDTFDITDTAGEPWLVRDETLREVVLEPFRLFCFDCESEGEDNGDDCGGNGSCNNAVCQCEEGFYGLRCEFTTPCSRLAIDARTDDFASTRDWSTDYQTIELESGSLVEAYYRPVYIHQYDSSDYDVVMFTGRRWALTSSEFLPRGGKISDEDLHAISDDHKGVGHEIGNFFQFIFHGYKGFFYDYDDYSVAFLSDYMDATTHRDSSSPVGFQWFRAVDEERTSDNENQGPAREVDTEFLCRVCDEGSNPCLYDGTCIEGACQCSLDSSGSLCEIPPVRNGHCDPFFNTPEFKMDGGDCCESTCVKTSQYICGAEEQGYVSMGYFSCKLPNDQWQDDPLNGEAGSFSGFAVDLSIRSLAVSELLQDRVRIYDKVGSSWVLRDTIEGEANSRFGNTVALSSGPYNVVSNPSFLAPLVVAITDGFRNLRIYRCNMDGCTFSEEFPSVFQADLSDDGTVLATSLFTNNAAPTQIRVYESLQFQGSFQARADFNVTKSGALFDVFSMSLSGDGSTLVVQNQRSEWDPERGFYIATDDFFDVRVYNGVSYELETEFRYEAGFNSNAYQFSLGVSQDGTVVAFGDPDCDRFQLRVFSRDDKNNWVTRTPPPLDTSECSDSQRPPRNNNLALSMDGSMIAFRLGITVQAFKWESQEWHSVGDRFPLTNYPVSMSSDGTELAIGSPEDGIGGITNVNSLPGRKVCLTSNTSLLRISLTIDRLPNDITWDLKNNQTGEILYQQGPYPEEYAYGTIVEETCINNDSCFVFSIYNKRNRGLQAPGQYALFLNGNDIGRGTFGGLFEKISFGNCNSCPNGTEPFSLLMLTCGPLQWALLEVIDQGASATVLQEGSSIGMVSDETMYESCAVHGGIICDTPVQLSYDTCLDPTECYAVSVISPNRSIAHLELELGGKKTETDAVSICAGSSAFVGNPDKCLQEDG